MNEIFLYLSAFFPLAASLTTISGDQYTIEFGIDCMGQSRAGINIHYLVYDDDQIRKFSYPTYCCGDYYIRFTHSSIPTLATASFGNQTIYVVDLRMNNVNISKILPGTFTELTYLNCLDLSQNNISVIPYGIFNKLKRLHILNLANNNIKHISNTAFDSVPLKKLFLQHNLLSFLDDKLFSSLNDSLTLIDLSKNILKDINNTFVGMNSMISLNLNHNYIKNVNLANMYSIEIYLKNNNVSHISAVRNMTRIIDLSENNIQSIEDLGSGFINSSIEKLYLSRNSIQLKHNSLASLYQLTHLYLDYNKVRNISSIIFKDVKSLHFLDISHNDISQIQYDTFDHVNNMQYLNISCNKFTKLQLHTISHILSLRKTIRIIDLSENDIQSIEDLRSAFMNSSIVKLYLSRNAIQLTENSFVGLYSLTHLYLDNNKVRNISKMVFQDLKSLIFLDISHNDIAHFSYGTFDHMSDMQYLNISFNKLTELQLHIFSSLQKLTELDFGNNQITDLDTESFLYHCSTLQKINVDGNLWNCKALTNIIKYCQTKNVEVVRGNSIVVDNVRGIACDDTDFAVNKNTTRNNVNENLLKSIENLLLRNHEIRDTHSTFGVLLVVILVFIFILMLTILILSLKKGSYESTSNIISHQDNVELL